MTITLKDIPLPEFGMPEARPGHLTVGRYRASSQNDVLTP